MAQHRSLTDAQERDIAKKYAKGERTGALAVFYEVHQDTIRNAVLRQGGELRSRGGQPKTTNAKLRSVV